MKDKNKKSINIITYHRACNYGAVLQAYATLDFFKTRGYEAKLIDYTPKYLRNYKSFSGIYNQVDNLKYSIFKRILETLIKMPSYIKLQNTFSKFVEKKLEMTKKYETIEEIKDDIPKADYYCCGSDQIWNNYYTKDFDDMMFLDFLDKDSKCISFASSFGKNKFDVDDCEHIRKKLEKFSLLSVREKDGLDLLNNMGFKNSLMLLDPTLLVDYNMWNLLADSKINYNNYILVYQLHGDSDAYKYALEMAKKKNMKVIRIITMYHQIRFGAKNIIIPNINDFLSLFKNASYVFTDSFHGCVFSLIFKRKLGVRLPVRFSNRITSLMNLIDGEKFIVNSLESWEKDITIEYIDKTYKKLEEKKEKNINEYLNLLDKI